MLFLNQRDNSMKTPPRTKNSLQNEPDNSAPVLPASDRKMRNLSMVVFVMASGLIAAAARGDLWLDEIWSIMFAASSASPADIFIKFQHDNNHIINTLYLYWLGTQKLFYIYRLLSVVTGVGSIWLVGIIARKWGRTEQLFGLLLAGTSYPLILYFSESRGYAPAIFFALLCFALLQVERPHFHIIRAVIFSLACVLGILSHATFVMVMLALFLLFTVQELNQFTSLKTMLLKAGLYFLVPFTFSTWFYLFFIRNIQFGGGPIYSKWEVVCRAASLTIGLPEGTRWGPVALIFAAAVLTIGTVHFYREKSSLWVFFPAMLFVAPFLAIVLTQPTYLYFRYFIVCIPFFYLILGYSIATYYRSGNKIGQLLLIAFMLFFVTAQMQRIIPLLRFGRGNYTAAINYIVSNSKNNRISIGSDHDFRNKVLLAFYGEFLPKSKRLYYLDQPDWDKAAPEWIVTHSQDRSYRPPKQLTIPGVGKYRLMKSYRFGGISGWSWFLFRQESTGETK